MKRWLWNLPVLLVGLLAAGCVNVKAPESIVIGGREHRRSHDDRDRHDDDRDDDDRHDDDDDWDDERDDDDWDDDDDDDDDWDDEDD